jgi:hypothetical protein
MTWSIRAVWRRVVAQGEASESWSDHPGDTIRVPVPVSDDAAVSWAVVGRRKVVFGDARVASARPVTAAGSVT